ncbi:MAG: long-chain fatty acid--CoA ligase [Planctomycetota bacterium]|nr:MAG: long-chain fatty acid--CoA ligase [Planctomycetota bacterium]REK37403.1 MAG: long-chain fatty acid--CoA ligase [Planctomycetota bacterium]
MSELIFEGKRTDLAELWQRAQVLAVELAEGHRVGPGANVLLTLEFSDAALELLAASWLLQARCVLLPPTCSRALFESVVAQFAPAAIGIDSRNERLRSGLERDSMTVGDADGGHVVVYTAEGTGAAGEAVVPSSPPASLRTLLEDQPQPVFFTSGSTSQAKGVVLEWPRILDKGEAVLEHYRVADDERVVPILPFSHVYGLYPVLGALARGASCVLCRETVPPGEIAQAISRERASVVICPPLTAQFLFGRHAPSAVVQENLRVLSLGGAAMAADVLEQIRQNLPQTQLYLSYGLAETYSTICCVDVSAEPERVSTVGPARFLAEVQARDPNSGHPVPRGEIGELCIGGQITSGYYGAEHDRQTYFAADGWLRTGDLGCVDEQGYVSIRGRLKETINAGGLSIDPSEIEEVVLAHPSVQDCGVVGAERMNREYPVAAVVLDAAATDGADEATAIEELFAHCRRQLSAKLVPGKIVVVAEIPRGALGKIERATLKNQIV